MSEILPWSSIALNLNLETPTINGLAIKAKENNVRSANSITTKISTTKTTIGIDSIAIPKNYESESFNLEVKTPAPDINKA